jgi:TonB family protein
MPRLRFTLASIFLPALFPFLAAAQGPVVQPPAPADAEFPRAYENSSHDLRWQLQDVLNVATDPNRSRLESLIRLMEIPNSKEWFTKVFGREVGETWAGDYDANLNPMERNLEDVLTQVAGQDGEFLTRVVNDGPAPARKIEAAMIKALRGPVEIYFVSWKQRGSPPESRPTVIGYFVFVDGTFRLDSAMTATELQPEAGANDSAARTAGGPDDRSEGKMNDGVYRPGVGGVGYPTCVRCPDPKYPNSARKKKLEGTVTFRVIVQPDGGITDIQLVESPDPDLTESAMETIKQWHMNPARRVDGEPVRVVVPIEVTFRLVKYRDP